MEKYFSSQDCKDAEKVLSCFTVKTDCFLDGKVINAKYLVAIDDDESSAFFAAYLYHLIYKTHGYHPFVLCVGGVGRLSRYLNNKDETEGENLRRVCIALGVRRNDICVLCKGTNTGKNLLEIVSCVSLSPGKMVMCLTGRLSLRVRQTFMFLDKQYADCLDKKAFRALMQKGVYYYVPEVGFFDQAHEFNSKKIANKLLLFSEVASIYNRVRRYSGTFQAPLDFEIPLEVVEAAKRLEDKYPLKNRRFCFTYLWQFIYAWFSLKVLKNRMKKALKQQIDFNRQKLLNEFDFLDKGACGLYTKQFLN